MFSGKAFQSFFKKFFKVSGKSCQMLPDEVFQSFMKKFSEVSWKVVKASWTSFPKLLDEAFQSLLEKLSGASWRSFPKLLGEILEDSCRSFPKLTGKLEKGFHSSKEWRISKFPGKVSKTSQSFLEALFKISRKSSRNSQASQSSQEKFSITSWRSVAYYSWEAFRRSFPDLFTDSIRNFPKLSGKASSSFLELFSATFWESLQSFLEKLP